MERASGESEGEGKGESGVEGDKKEGLGGIKKLEEEEDHKNSGVRWAGSCGETFPGHRPSPCFKFLHTVSTMTILHVAHTCSALW